MEKPFAITLDGSSRANKTGSWRTERADTSTLSPAATGARRARTSAVALRRRVGRARLREGLAHDHGRQPVSGDHGPGLLPPLRDRLQPGELDDAVGINSVERFLGDQAIEHGWRVDVTLSRRASGPHRRSRADGPLRGLPPRPAGARRDRARRRLAAGGMMRYGIPAYRLPRDILDAEVARILDLGVDARARHPGRRWSRAG